MRVIYIGGYVDEAIVRERGLRSHNAAGSNRMARIGRALAVAGFRPVLLSPASSLRAWTRGPLLHPVRMHRAGKMPVVFAAAVNFIGLNILISPLLQFLALRGLMRKGNIAGAMIYNFNPSLVLLTAYLKYFWGLPLLQNVEDISVPRLRDWLPKSDARPVQQLVFWMCQHAIARMVDGYVVPTRRFLSQLPHKPATAVVTGCVGIEGYAPQLCAPPLRVLFAGKIEREHGILAFIEALKALDAREIALEIEVDVTGAGTLARRVEHDLRTLRRVRARNHGFVSAEAYQGLLERAHVCVALQDPEGRYARFKTPSKVYEFLAYGKAVVATNVGDIAELDENVLIVLPTLTTDLIVAALEKLAADPETTAKLRWAARSHAEQYFSYEAVGSVIRRLLIAVARRPA